MKIFNMFFFHLLFALIFSSCAENTIREKQNIRVEQLNINIDSAKKTELESIFKKELAYIQTIQENNFQLELNSLLKNISVIDYRPYNCSTGQVACSQKNEANTIYINQNFFQLSGLEQFTTLLHESKHLESGLFDHCKCQKVATWGHECDEDLNSPYGIEYKYLLHKYMHSKDEQTAQLLIKIFNRINKV